MNSSSDELVASTSTAGGVATVEFSRSLQAGQSADLTFEFRGPALIAAPLTLPFPAFTSFGATERTGVLAIDPGHFWAIDTVPGVGALASGWLDFTEPLIPPGATDSFRYRGTSPDGVLNLTPVSADFSAQSTTRVVPIPDGLMGSTTFTISLRRGELISLMLVESEGGATGRTFRVLGFGNSVLSAVSLPAQSLWQQPVNRWAGRPSGSPGSRRRLGRDLVRPFRRPVTDTGDA